MTANSERIRIGVGDDRIEGTFLSPGRRFPACSSCTAGAAASSAT